MIRLIIELTPCSGTSWMLMIGTPSRSSRRARNARNWTRSGHHLHVHHLAARALDQIEHLDVLFERQRHVQMIDVLLLHDFSGVGQRAEQRQAAIPEVIAAGAIVHEAHHLIAELTMLQDLLRHHPAQVAGAGNEDALVADARLPTPLQHFPHELARAERQRDVEHQEQPPDDLRDLVRADVLQFRESVVGLEVQRA